jgi:hypothetical protein
MGSPPRACSSTASTASGARPGPPCSPASPSDAAESLDGCGPLAWLAVGARFWPQLAATELERMTSSLGGAPLLGNLRNVAAVVRHLPDAKASWESSTVLLGSLAGEKESAVTDCSRRRRAEAENQTFGGRVPKFFDLSAARASPRPASSTSRAGTFRSR